MVWSQSICGGAKVYVAHMILVSAVPLGLIQKFDILNFLKYIYKYNQPLGSPRKVSQVLNPKDLSILTASLVFDGVLIKPLVHLKLFVDPESMVWSKSLSVEPESMV